MPASSASASIAPSGLSKKSGLSRTSISTSSTSKTNRTILPPPKFITEAQQSLLYFRAVDADAPDSILGDVAAKNIVNKIDLGVVQTMARDLRYVKFWCLRAQRIDTWCREFMAEHPNCTVLNLSVGLDTRIQRLQPPSTVRWIDVDHPDVLEFRERVFPSPSIRSYKMIAADIADDDFLWVYGMPNDRPTLVIAESNMFYFRPEVSKGIFFHIAEHFNHGEIVFDVLGSLAARLINMRLATVQKESGMKILWPVDNPLVMNDIHPRLKFHDEYRYTQDMPPWFGEFKTKILKLLPGYQNLGRIILLRFGGDENEEQGERQQGEEVDTVGARRHRSYLAPLDFTPFEQDTFPQLGPDSANEWRMM